MKKRRILMGKTHLIAGAVMLAVGHAVELGHSDYY